MRGKDTGQTLGAAPELKDSWSKGRIKKSDLRDRRGNLASQKKGESAERSVVIREGINTVLKNTCCV